MQRSGPISRRVLDGKARGRSALAARRLQAQAQSEMLRPRTMWPAAVVTSTVREPGETSTVLRARTHSPDRIYR
jgi:hypothetical protein